MAEENIQPKSESGMVGSALDKIDTELKKDDKVYAHVKGISKLIADLRDDIKNTKVEEAAKVHVPLASDELSEVLKSIEGATNSIMEQTEAIEAHETASKIPEVQDSVTKIYEACSFQDITGQRISKIIRAIQSIDRAINDLIGDVSGAELPAKKQTYEESLLNGPQNEEDAISQDEIDKLLNG